MTRALSSTWRALPLALLLLAVTSTAAFAGKPTIGVLGVEVIDSSGNIDQTSTTVAHDLTERLRDRAKQPSGPYQLASGTDKELIDEKLIKNCDDERQACMVEIGKDLGVDFLMYGRLEKKADGYQVSINLLNIKKNKFEKSKVPLMIPYSAKDQPSILAKAKAAYNDLTGQVEKGSLIITSNADHGTILLNRTARGQLSSGQATIQNLDEDRYTLTIQADGYKNSDDQTVTIRSGEPTKIDVRMVEIKPIDGGGGGSGSLVRGGFDGDTDHHGTWKKLAIGGAVATVGFGVAFGIEWHELAKTGRKPDSFFPEYGEFCGTDLKPNGMGSPPPSAPQCKHGSRTKTLTYVTGIGMGVSGLFTLFALYKSYVDKDEHPPAGSTAPIGAGRSTKQRRKALSVTPVLSPDGAGATLQFDW